MIYLDNAATSAQKPLNVFFKLFKESLITSVNAGRGAHRKSIRAMAGINNTAESLAELFNIDDPTRIAFFPNATYALNCGIFGVLNDGDHAITTVIDHNSVLRPIVKHGNFTIVPADKNGFVNPMDIENAILPSTKLIVCTHASNVCGSIQDVAKISDIAKEYNILFLLDASQTVGTMTIDIKKLKPDMMAFSGHKGLLGPLGTGGLYVSSDIQLSPLITGGTGSMSESLIQPYFMPDILQSGTMNTPAIIALGTAVRDIIGQTDYISHFENKLANRFIEDLMNIENVIIYGTTGKNRNGTVAFNIKGVEPSELEYYLDRKKKIITRSGYHCAPLAHKALGSDKTGCVRVSFGFFNTNCDRMAITDAIYEFVNKKPPL